MTEGGVVLADYDWDVLSRRDLTKLNNNAFSMDFAYEDDDDLATLTHTGPAPVTYTLGRNQVGQITSLGVTDGAFLSRPPTAATDAYAANRLNQISALNAGVFAYDANGNLTSDGTFTYEYDEENRLRSAVSSTSTAQYEFDPLGRRRAKLVDGIASRFVHSGEDEIEERSGSNSTVSRFYYGPGVDDRIGIMNQTYCPGTGRCFYAANWQGSTISVVRQDGSLQEVFRYGPFGEDNAWTPMNSSSSNPFRFIGRRHDDETGLYYLRARNYSPRLGRFLQVDPGGRESDINLYVYARSDPANFLDSGGRDAAVKVWDSGRVEIKVPIHFSGPAATSSNIQAVKSNIESRWSGQIGKYDVTTTVEVRGAESRFDVSTNQVTLIDEAGAQLRRYRLGE
ncbi:MAG: RHS repeat-associated core domain-containing protein [Rhodospirillales bacterium]|nr:RHS repeat-associated core domain-containing protein [Rhodospirillales bacterium]